VAANRLRRKLAAEDRVVLVERDPVYRFAPSFLWLMTGERRPEQISVELGRLRRRGIELVEAEARAIDTAARRIETTNGPIGYDRLVIALGADLAPELLPGFSEAALNVYTLDGAVAAGRALEGFAAGRVVVLVSRLPYKCPAAPYETALLSEALLRKRGVRDRSSVEVYTPEPFPMPTAGPDVGAAVRSTLEARGIGFHPEQTVEQIDHGARELVLAGGDRVPYDLLLGVPPHRAPGILRESPLAGPTGFVPVDPTTLATEADGVYAIGDAASIPLAGGKFLPKAGVFANKQAQHVAARIAAELRGTTPSGGFDGSGACFLELGDGAAAYASGSFYGETGPTMRLRRPGRHWHLAKIAVERYYLRRWLR
ncbi:MAG: NAD(P)/FAD-dependent oxidoreductase, partial [Acidobacteriota bacterium]|nr:NAD(P)/FAD-dependent oxidoreductase [Acidobacteriota bacterium]